MTTTNAVPSSDVSDFVFNVQKLDEIATGSALTYVDRLGVERSTAAGAMARFAALNPRGAWVTATVYQPRDLVLESGTWYIALDTHTSGATFAGDLSAHWRPEQGVTRADLANDTSASDGAGLLALNATLNYVANSLGRRAVLDYWSPADYPWLAKFDGSTDDTAAINACATACRAATPYKGMKMPMGKAVVSSSLDFSGLTVCGGGRFVTELRATSAQFDVITSTGNTNLSDFGIHGGWDGSTGGLSGDSISLKPSGSSLPYHVHIDNLRITNSKARGIYIEKGGYSSINRVLCNASGLHGLELWGEFGVLQCTTIQVGGFSVFSDCPFGYGVKMTECVNILFNGAIIEYTKGIQVNSIDNRSICLHGVYQENTTGGKFVDWAGSSGIGFEVRGCFGGGASITYNANWAGQSYSGNSSLTEPAIPVDGYRIILADGGENTTSAAGSVTAASISLPPGTWDVKSYVQTIDASGGALDKLGARLTTNVADGGQDFATSVLNFATETVYANPGALANLRVTPADVIVNSTSSNVTYYLRAYIGRTAGVVAYRGAIKAVRLT